MTCTCGKHPIATHRPDDTPGTCRMCGRECPTHWPCGGGLYPQGAHVPAQYICEACRESRLASFRVMLAGLKGMPTPTPPPHATENAAHR